MTLLESIADDVGRVFVRDFSEVATYTPAGGSARSLAVVFDRVSEVTDIGAMIQMDGVAAFVHLETAQAEELAIGDAMTVRGLSYRVVGVEPDGTGVTRAVLGI